MFELDPRTKHLEASPDRVLILLHSVNAVSVKVPGYPVEPAKAYVAAWEAGDGAASVLIYLHYGESNRAAVYRPSPAVFPIGDLPDRIEDARLFLESMGCLLDDMSFAQQPPERRQALVRTLPLFHASPESFAVAREAEELPEANVVALEEVPGGSKPTRGAVARLLLSC